MPSQAEPNHPRIHAIIFDMDNTLFDFVAAKQHACREVAKFLGRDDWEALFSCFLDSPHGFESHENLRDYFDLCGLLEECISGKNPLVSEGSRNKLANGRSTHSEDRPIPHIPGAPDKGGPSNVPTSPSACAISPDKGSSPQIPFAPAEGRPEPSAGTPTSREDGSARPPSPAVRDNLLADKSLYCNGVFSRCCAIYEAEKVRVLSPYPGVRETLAELKRRGFPLAVLTDAHNGNALARLRKTDLFQYFDHVISYDMTGAKKPAPDAFLLALKLLQTLPSETLLIGDSIRRDIAPAQALGMITAYAAYGDRNVRGRDPPGCRPDYVLSDIGELVELV
jgi:putative hydrolase of the HAD superfamily